MSYNNPYRIFDNYVLRTPLFSFSKYKKFTAPKVILDEDYKKLCENKIFREAIFLASPIFFEEMVRWLNDEIIDKRASKKIKITILKYFSRMSSRCTPFGLFSGCSVGKFDVNTDIQLEEVTNYKRHTRLDMHYLVALSQNLIKNPKIKKQILFYPNTSIYKAGDKLRYVEYYYLNGNRKHDMVAVDDSEYLNLILKKAANGCLLPKLAEELVDAHISLDDALEFMEELVDSQLLISELEPSVSGPEFLQQICEVLKKINDEDIRYIYNVLIDVGERIKKLDLNIGNDPNEYIEISELLKQLGTEFKLNFLFQTDTVIVNKENKISKKIGDDVLRAFALLNRTTFTQPKNQLTEFKDAFYKRYETREVELSKVLDIEMGIGYKQVQESGDSNPLIDDLMILNKSTVNQYHDLKWSPINSIFQKKFHEKPTVVKLTDDDFSHFDVSWDDLPDTLSSIAEIIYIDNEEKIRFSASGGSSATLLLGRFCHSHPQINHLVRKIIDVENKINNDAYLLAEIVHLPESRIGNVIIRPELRNFEIPYLARSIKPEESQLTINDLKISIKGKNGKLVLRSVKYNKEVKPRMANAHSYGNNSLPIYHFLCDMQNQNLREGIGLQLGPLINSYNFIPRIEYKNIILQDAIWHLTKKDVNQMIDVKNDDLLLISEINTFRQKLNIPQFVMLIENDNELIINFENLDSVRMLLSSIKKLLNFKISEFLFSKDGVVGQNESYHTNQLILSFYNEEKFLKSNGE